MCGLVSVINRRRNGFIKKQLEIFTTLLFIDYLRGQDSTGVFMVDNNGDVKIAKEASDPLTFMDSQAFDDICRKADRMGSALVGHNRKATRGMITDENAHPFWVDDKIVLVHNGVMYGDHKKHADVEVDSHAIAHVIHEKNGNVEEALGSFNAAYALIWYDVEKKRLNITRNSERPLWWFETADEFVIASEKCMLEFVMAKLDVKPLKGPFEFRANDLQMFDLESSTWKGSYRSLEIKRPVTQLQVLGPQGRQRVAMDDTDWPGPGTGFDDVPFEVQATERLRVAMAAAGFHDEKKHEKNLEQQLADEKLIKVETKSPDVHALNQMTEAYERELAKGTNRLIPNGQFYADIINRYPKESEVHAIAFDYTYANQHDNSGGYYLYLSVWDDNDTICRLWLTKDAGEGRMEQIAGTGYVYRLKVNRKWWGSFNRERETKPTTPGYTIMECRLGELVYGGGIGDKEWGAKLTRAVVKH